jgi:hypothetical protein
MMEKDKGADTWKHKGVDTWKHLQSEDGIDWKRLVSSIRGVENNRAQEGDGGNRK